LALNFDVEEDVYQVALTYPYSFSKLQFYLDLIDEHFPSFIHREVIGHTIVIFLLVFFLYFIEIMGAYSTVFYQQNRPVDLLTITNQAPESDEETKPVRKKTVFIICRSHPGESPASIVCQGKVYVVLMHFTESLFNIRKFYPGLIDFLVSSEPIARALRDFIEFKIIPMINPDGVFNGNERYFPYYNSCECSDCRLKFHYKRRSSMVGADLNRVWNDYSEYFHPTVKAAMDAIRHLDEQPVRLVKILKHSQNIYLQQLVINYL
jgi:Na+-transporting methylmalonyl-CoA/oxaloacetate decarboxylase gamma subunit